MHVIDIEFMSLILFTATPRVSLCVSKLMARQPGERCSGGDFKDQMIEQGHIRMLVRIGP